MPNFHWPDWACGRYASSMSSDPRYHRQTLLPGIGERGQERLRDSTVLIAGCGALGTVAADLLCRAGVGTLVIVDRDVVEATNLQRQTLFTERDAERGIPKAEAARLRLGQANSTVRIRAFVEDIPSRSLNRDESKALSSCMTKVTSRLDDLKREWLRAGRKNEMQESDWDALLDRVLV